jgi:hypothetical protein
VGPVKVFEKTHSKKGVWVNDEAKADYVSISSIVSMLKVAIISNF